MVVYIVYMNDSLEKRKPKILIIHDRFQFKGGAERLVLILAKALEADIATEFWTDESFTREDFPGQLFVLDEGEPNQIVWRYFRAHCNFFFKTRKFIKNYDVVIFSGNNCLTASFHISRSFKILYCHAPVRYVYDLLERRRAEQPALWKRLVYFDLGKWVIRIIYRLGLLRMDTVIANSRNVQRRLKHFCNTDSQVVFPPIETSLFTWISQKDYYLSFGRVDELKRVSDIVRAFQKMPDKKLIISSGGDDLENIKKLAEGYSNISVIGWVSNTELRTLIGNCIASLYLPIDEDFGMVPLESMSAGKPCIGVDEGGLKETIIHNKTGILLPKDYTTEDIINAVKQLTPEKTLSMTEACIRRAAEFSTEGFIEKMKEIIEKQISNSKELSDLNA